MPISQDKQRIKLDTPLGKDVFLVQNMVGEETMSKPFQFSFQVISEEDSVDQTKIVGKSITCSILCNDGEERFFNGYVRQLAVGNVVETKYRQYFIDIVPWLSLLQYKSDCRIFQEKSVKDIIEDVFKGLGFNDFTWKLQGTYKPREYCVQYRETDFDFVTRLMEEEGIFYFFKHEKGKHTLVLADYAKAYEKVPLSSIDVIDGTHTDYSLNAWRHNYNFCSGKVSHTDYDFEAPSTSLLASQQTIVKLPNLSNYEIYDYPGTYTDKSAGSNIARTRMEAFEAQHDIVNTTGDYPMMSPGYVFKVGKHSNKSEEKQSFVCSVVRHRANEGSYRAGDTGSFNYINEIECVPDAIALRPLRTRSKPYISGTQTAVVSGASSDEIYTDKYGRIKVQFFWDREGKKDDKSSCWIRVAQLWSGKKWGAQFIPRVGQEVLISFMEGDPDRPIVVGSVYNAEQMPTYDLPANKTTSGIKTRSTKSGGTENYNEIRFQDEKGKELFYLHAEKDQEEMVENNQKSTVGANQTISIGNDSTETVGNDLSQEVAKNVTFTTGEEHTETIGKNMTLTVGEDQKEDVGGNQTSTIGSNYTQNVGSASSISVGKEMSMSVGKDLSESIGGSHSESVSKDYKVKAKTITLDASSSITIKCGSAKITMSSSGAISISGSSVNVKGSGSVAIKASGSVSVKGSTVGNN